MLGLFWEIHQHQRIAEAESAATRGAEKALDAASQVRSFEERLDKLTLVSMALWSLLKETTDLTEEDLMERVKEIDLSDGKLDGKVRHALLRCPECSRVMSAKHKCCLYCGYDKPESHTAFDGVVT